MCYVHWSLSTFTYGNVSNPHFTNEESAQRSEVKCLSNPAKSGRTSVQTQLASVCALDCCAIPPLRKKFKVVGQNPQDRVLPSWNRNGYP